MKVPLSWVNEFVNLNDINLDILIEKLTLAGFEVEEKLIKTINNKSEIILDLSATANRADSLSIYGISQEIASILNQPITFPNQLINENFNLSKINSINTLSKFENNYSDFVVCKIETKKLYRTPDWMQHKLICCDITPENNVKDLMTYILLETGYPFQFYDLTKISHKLKTNEFNLSIKEISEKNNLDLNINNTNTNYSFNKKIVGLYANNLLIGLPGIISTETVSIDNTTTNILIEGSIFNSKYIRQTARQLSLRTERSARYEKGINNSNFLKSYSRLIELLKSDNQNLKLVCETKILSENLKPNQINLNLKTINEILGPVKIINGKKIYLTINEIESYFTRLKFQVIKKTNEIWQIVIPTIRTDDITKEIDLIEEIGRLHGFNNFVTKLPNIEKIGEEDNSYKFRKKLNSCFLNEGFNEIINYSLVPTFYKNEIKLTNPLISDCSTLRKSLLPALVKNCEENTKQGNLIFDGFEYGHIFELDEKYGYKELEVVSGIFGNFTQRNDWDKPIEQMSWFEAKGKLEMIFEKLSLKTLWLGEINCKYENIFHPYKSATISAENTGTIIGTFGEINPIFAKKYNISSNIYLFEFNFEILKNNDLQSNLPRYLKYSSYPKITKDLSIIVKNNISFDKIQNYIYQINSNLLTNVELLDKYYGESIPIDHSSLCIKLTFQSDLKTLKTNEVEQFLKKIEIGLQSNFNTIIRN